MSRIHRRDALKAISAGAVLATTRREQLFADSQSELVGFALDRGNLLNLALDDRKRLRLAKSETGYGKQGEFVSAVGDQKVEYPEVDIVDGKYRMWFCGNGFGSVGYSEGIQETGLTISVRSGDSAKPNVQWKPWKTVERSKVVAAGRYVQVKAQLRSENPLLSPAINRIGLVAAGE